MVKRYWVPAIGTALGLGGLIAYFRARGQSRPAGKSHGLDAEAQTRAYLSLLDTTFHWGTDQVTRDTATVTLRWENVGRTPAYNVGLSYALEFVPVQQTAIPAPSAAGFPLSPQRGQISLQPGESINRYGGQVPAAMTRKWIAGEYAVLVYSSTVYTDAVGKENRIDTCSRALCEEIDGQRIVTLKAAKFNNAVIYGFGAEK